LFFITNEGLGVRDYLYVKDMKIISEIQAFCENYFFYFLGYLSLEIKYSKKA